MDPYEFAQLGECVEAIPGDLANGQDALRLQVTSCTDASVVLSMPCSEGCGSCMISTEARLDSCVLADAGDIQYRYVVHSLSCPESDEDARPMPTDLGSGLVIDGYAPAVAGYLDVPEELVRSALLADAQNPPTDTLEGCARRCDEDASCVGFTYDSDAFRCWPFSQAALGYPLQQESGDGLSIFTFKKALGALPQAAEGGAPQVDCGSAAADDCFRRCVPCMDCEVDGCSDADGNPCSACEECSPYVPCFFQAQDQVLEDATVVATTTRRPTTTAPEADFNPDFNPCADPAAYDPTRPAEEASCRNHDEIRDEVECAALRGLWLPDAAECSIGENRTACALLGGVMVATTCADIGLMFGHRLTPETCDMDLNTGLTGRQMLYRAGVACCPGSGPAPGLCGPMINPCREPAQFTGDLALQYWCSGASATLTVQACAGPGNFWDAEAGACVVETAEACADHGLEWVPRTCKDAISYLEFDSCSVGQAQCASRPQLMQGSTLEQAISYYGGFCCGGGEVTTLCSDPGSVPCSEGAEPAVARVLQQEPTHPGWSEGGQTSDFVPPAGGCATTCRGETCDYWFQNGYPCEELQQQNCDCTNCHYCSEEIQAPPPPLFGPVPSPGVPPPVPPPVDCGSQEAEACVGRCSQCWSCEGGDCGSDLQGRPCQEDCFVANSECISYVGCFQETPDCPMGFMAKDGICYPCAVGTYQPEFGSTGCYDCPAGEFTSQVGSSECFACPRGKFSAAAGSSECAKCPPGSFQGDFGKTECQECAPFYTSGAGAAQCHPTSQFPADPCECMDLWEWEGQTYAGCAETNGWPGLAWCYAKGAELCGDRAIRSDINLGLFWVECEVRPQEERVLEGDCSDTPGYVDERMSNCGFWEGRDCTKAVEQEGYSKQGEVDVLANCPNTCGFCAEAPECAANEDCYSTECSQPGWLNLGCNYGRCYTGTPDPTCEGQENGLDLGNGRWCWDGRVDTYCPAKAQLSAGSIVVNFYDPQDGTCSNLWSFMMLNFTAVGQCVPFPQVPDDWNWPTNGRYAKLMSCGDGAVEVKALCNGECEECMEESMTYTVGGCRASASEDSMSTSIGYARCPSARSTSCATIPQVTAQRLKAITCARWNDPNERWNQPSAPSR